MCHGKVIFSITICLIPYTVVLFHSRPVLALSTVLKSSMLNIYLTAIEMKQIVMKVISVYAFCYIFV